MAIFEDVMKIGAEGDFSPEQKVGPDFFTQSFSIPEEQGKKEGGETANPFSDWKTSINRMFMKGWDSKKILDSIQEQLESSDQKSTILSYIQKYEGLIGTVFVDSGVLEQGFPLSMIPRGWNQYHKFSINCHHPILKSERKVDGGASGDIQAFLSAEDQNTQTEMEMCSITGLPVLKKGMFGKEEILSLMEERGWTGEPTLKNLQKHLLKEALGKEEKEREIQEFQPADTKFSLQEQKVEVEPLPEQAQEEEEGGVLKYKLKPNGLKAGVVHTQTVKVENYSPSRKQDVEVDEEVEDHGPISVEDTEVKVNPQDVQFMSGVVSLDYLPSEKQDVSFENQEGSILQQSDMGLTEQGLMADSQKEEKMEGEIFLSYAKSKKEDLVFEKPVKVEKSLKMDSELRF